MRPRPLAPTAPAEAPAAEPDLLVQIDATARTLLRKIGGDGNLTKQQSEILTEQVKAFDVVVKWAQVRKDLLPREEPRATKFASMKGQFHGGSGPAPRNRGSASEATREDRAVPAAPGPPDADPGDGGDSDN